MSLSSSCHPLVVNKPHPRSCCGASLQRQCLYFILQLYTSFYALINVYRHRSGADNPRGQNLDVNRKRLSLQSFATSLKKNLFEV